MAQNLLFMAKVLRKNMEINSISTSQNPSINQDLKAKQDQKTKQTQKAQSDQEEKSPSQKLHDFLFTNADEKFLNAFSSITKNMHILDASFMKTVIDIGLVNFHKEKIVSDLQAKSAGKINLTPELRQKIYSQAQNLAQENGFKNIDMNQFLSFLGISAQENPLFKDNKKDFFSNLQVMYNTKPINLKT